MSVLAHLVSLLELPAEPAATRALEYVLGNPDALQAFVEMLAPIGVSFEPRGVEGEMALGDGRPDLVVYDLAGKPRLLVENKFWAALTSAQPVTYLAHLPQDDKLSALVFLVPEKRVQSVWGELKRRCAEAELSVAEQGRSGAPFAGKLSGNRVMAVTDWRSVLDGLAEVGSVRPDVEQLRALTDRMDAETFLPIRADELTDADIARRMINFVDLVRPIVDKLIDRGVADIDGLRATRTPYTIGRYMHMRDGRLGLWLGVDLELWRDAGTTPLWWKVHNTDFGGVSEIWPEIDGLFDDVQTNGEAKCLPIRLKTGVEKDAVIADAADQMVAIADRLVAAMPG